MLSLGAWVVVLAYLGVRGCGRLRTLGEWVSVYARFAVCDDLFGPLAPCWCVVSSLDHPWTVLRSCRWCLVPEVLMRWECCPAASPLVSSVLSLTVNNLTLVLPFVRVYIQVQQ